MLGLKVKAEAGRILETLAARLEDVDGLTIGATGEGLRHHAFQPFHQSLVHKTVEKIEVVRAAFQHPPDHEAGQVLGKVHIVVEIGKSDLGLDHPELGGVARRVGIFSPESRTEGIDLAKAESEAFGLKLTGNGQAAFLAEEILRKGVFARLHGGVGRQGGHAEHLARPLAVGAGQDGRVHVIKAVAVEEVMHRLRGLGPDAEGRPVFVGAHAQMGDGAQEFVGMTFFLERIGFGIGQTENGHVRGADFPFLPLAGRFHQLAADGDAGSRIHPFQLVPCGRALVHDALDVAEAGTVVQFQKRKTLGVAPGADPASNP